MSDKLTQSDLDNLSAYLDGELADQDAQRVASLLATDQVWQEAAAGLADLDAALSEYTTPAPAGNLAARIIAASRKEPMPQNVVIRIAKYLVPAAAAAAAIFAFMHIGLPSDPPKPAVAMHQQVDPSVDNLVIEHLDFFRQCKSIDVISHNENIVDDATMAALDKLESTRRGT